ncbi:MAG: ferritin-like domain-containing protein [Desulfurococcales archaeon]|nr:ferritin-like domain-containing protein [Desulfurococcales archaeon]
MSEELLPLVSEWSEEELFYAKELMDLAKKIKHPVLKALFESIAKDSEKHNLMLKAVKDYIEDKRPLLTEEDLMLIKDKIREHIERESKFIKNLTDLKEKIEDPAVLLIVEAQLEDEKRHHALLLQIEKMIAEKEKVSDQELWEALWLHSPYHGAPGG